MASPPTAIEMVPNTLADVATAKPSPPRPAAPPKPAPTKEPDNKDAVFLKQDGKVYLVKDWATLQRWIMENRVGRDDMVSEGGVQWDTVGAKPELGSFFAALEKLEAAEMAGIGLGAEALSPDPPTSEVGALARLDEATEGVPVGLPPLPTEEIFMVGAPEPMEESYPDLPPTKPSVDLPTSPQDLEPEVSTVDEQPDPSREVIAEVVEETPLPSNVMEFPDLNFEPTIHATDDLDDGDAAGLDASQLPDAESLPPDFGDFGDFNQPSADLGEASPTETDIPKDNSGLNFDESELFIDPNSIAPATTSFDDEFGQNFTPDPQDDVDLLEADNTEILETEDPFADFGDFFQDDVAVATTNPPRRKGLMIGIGAGVLVAIVSFAAYTGLPADTSASPNVAPSSTAPVAQEKEEAATAPEETPPTSTEDSTQDDTDGNTEDTEVPTEAKEVTPTPSPEPSGTESEPKADKPEPKLEPKPEPKPTPKPKPKPKPKVADSSALVDEGWKNVDRGRLKSAVTSFAKVLDKTSDHAEANYGLGYALIQQGRQQEAKRFLCTALNKVKSDSSASAVSTLRDVKGLLKNNQLSCD